VRKFLESRFAPIVVIGALDGAVFGLLFYFGAIALTLRNPLFTVAVFSAVIWLLIIGFGRLSGWGRNIHGTFQQHRNCGNLCDYRQCGEFYTV